MTFTRNIYWRIFLCIFILFPLAEWWIGHSANFWSLLSILALLVILGRFLIRQLSKWNIISPPLSVNLNTLLVAFLIALLACEVFLRCFIPGLKSYGEKTGDGDYTSSFYGICLEKCDSCSGGYFFIHAPNTVYDNKKQEYHYQHKYNSFGLRDIEFTRQKSANEFRILGLGDSFVEGVGTSGDSTWLKQLEYRLNGDSSITKYTTMNGGVQGSDLFFSYDLLKQCLLKYKPDLVILNLNSTDMSDIYFRGTDNRYADNGNYKPKPQTPWWEFYFATSYIVRAVLLNVFHYNWQLVSPARQRVTEDNILVSISKKINDYAALAQKEHFSFLLVLQPLKNELSCNENFISRLKVSSAIKKIDLTSVMSYKIKGAHGGASVFYWPIDGHYTSLGNSAEAEAIYNLYFNKQYYITP